MQEFGRTPVCCDLSVRLAVYPEDNLLALNSFSEKIGVPSMELIDIGKAPLLEVASLYLNNSNKDRAYLSINGCE
jgi:hypothetical protein